MGLKHQSSHETQAEQLGLFDNSSYTKKRDLHLIQVSFVGDDVMVLLLDGLQMGNNGISKSALKLAPSHVLHLFQQGVLHCNTHPAVM